MESEVKIIKIIHRNIIEKRTKQLSCLAIIGLHLFYKYFVIDLHSFDENVRPIAKLRDFPTKKQEKSITRYQIPQIPYIQTWQSTIFSTIKSKLIHKRSHIAKLIKQREKKNIASNICVFIRAAQIKNTISDILKHILTIKKKHTQTVSQRLLDYSNLHASPFAYTQTLSKKLT